MLVLQTTDGKYRNYTQSYLTMALNDQDETLIVTTLDGDRWEFPMSSVVKLGTSTGFSGATARDKFLDMMVYLGL